MLMKHLILTGALTLSMYSGMAQEPSNGGIADFNPTVLVQVSPSLNNNKKPERPPKGERKPSRKLTAHIGDGWVMIEGVDESDILSYDINGYDGFPLASFDSAPEFTETLFSLHGEYEVSFTTDEYIYTGYVWM